MKGVWTCFFSQSRGCQCFWSVLWGRNSPLSLSSPPKTQSALQVCLHPIYQTSRRTLDTVAVVAGVGYTVAELVPVVQSPCRPMRNGWSSCSQRVAPGQTPGFDDNTVEETVTIFKRFPLSSNPKVILLTGQCILSPRGAHHYLLILGSFSMSGFALSPFQVPHGSCFSYCGMLEPVPFYVVCPPALCVCSSVP